MTAFPKPAKFDVFDADLVPIVHISGNDRFVVVETPTDSFHFSATRYLTAKDDEFQVYGIPVLKPDKLIRRGHTLTFIEKTYGQFLDIYFRLNCSIANIILVSGSVEFVWPPK